MVYNTGSTPTYTADNFDYFRIAVYRSYDGYCGYRYIEEQSNWFVFANIDPELEMIYRVEKGSTEEIAFLSDKTIIDQSIYVKKSQLTDGSKNAVGVLLDDDGYSSSPKNRLAVNIGRAGVEIRGTPTVVIGQNVPDDFSDYIQEYVRDSGGSTDLNIDGSSTPVVFTFGADAERDILIHEIRVTLTCQDITMDGISFCSSPVLDNGVLIEVVADGTTYYVYNIVQNEDWLFFNSPQGMLLNNTGPKDVMSAGFYFGESMRLHAGHGNDQVRVTIRDDLTGNQMPNFFRVKAFGIYL